MGDYRLGFRSLRTEYAGLELPVEGAVPAWVDGALIRNGPGLFEAAGERLTHWFDGLAMLRRFAFADGEVTYTNRYLRTEAYDRATGDGGLGAAEFASTPSGFLRGLLARHVPTPTDNTNVSVLQVGDSAIALTETPRYTEFDPRTLETVGPWTFDDDISGHLACAHPVLEPVGSGENGRRRTIHLHTRFGLTHEYLVSASPPGSTERHPVARIETDRVGYMHSFAVTPAYVILIEPPLYVDLTTLVNPFSGGSFLETLSWEPGRGSRFLVVDRERGTLAAEIEGPPFFYFHQVNAYERDDEVVLDVVTFEDASVQEALSLSTLDANAFSHPMGDLERFHIDPADWSLSREPRFEGHLSLPRINEARWTRPYRYAFAQGAGGTDRIAFPTALRKIDVETGDASTYSHPDRYCGEPVFVPRPDGAAEDDGVVLSIVLDTHREQSGLLVLDGQTLDREAIAWVPDVLPFDFHGRFFGDSSGPAAGRRHPRGSLSRGRGRR